MPTSVRVLAPLHSKPRAVRGSQDNAPRMLLLSPVAEWQMRNSEARVAQLQASLGAATEEVLQLRE